MKKVLFNLALWLFYGADFLSLARPLIHPSSRVCAQQATTAYHTTVSSVLADTGCNPIYICFIH